MASERSIADSTSPTCTLVHTLPVSGRCNGPETSWKTRIVYTSKCGLYIRDKHRDNVHTITNISISRTDENRVRHLPVYTQVHCV